MLIEAKKFSNQIPIQLLKANYITKVKGKRHRCCTVSNGIEFNGVQGETDETMSVLTPLCQGKGVNRNILVWDGRWWTIIARYALDIFSLCLNGLWYIHRVDVSCYLIILKETNMITTQPSKLPVLNLFVLLGFCCFSVVCILK